MNAPQNKTRGIPFNPSISDALLSLRSAELEHIDPLNVLPSQKALPDITKIGRDGIDHININRASYDRHEICHVLSHAQRLPFMFTAIDCEVTSLGSLYVFLRYGAARLNGLSLDNNNGWASYKSMLTNTLPVANMYAIFMKGAYEKYQSNPAFAKLLTLSANLPFDHYSVDGDRKRRYKDSRVLAAIHEEVRQAIRHKRQPNYFNFLDEASKLAFEINHTGVNVRAADRQAYAVAAISITCENIALNMQKQKEQIATRAAERKVNQKQPAKQVQRKANPNEITYSEIMSGKSLQEILADREAAQAAEQAAQQQNKTEVQSQADGEGEAAAADAAGADAQNPDAQNVDDQNDHANDERFALPEKPQTLNADDISEAMAAVSDKVAHTPAQ